MTPRVLSMEVVTMKSLVWVLSVLVASAGFLSLGALPSASQEAAADRPTYVGAARCKMCHMPQFRSWEAGSMSKAWAAIKDAPDREKCVSCHTTGYGQPGGFTTLEATPNLVGVQCESCHGPGSAHVALPVANREPAARAATINKFITDCRSCHNAHVLDKAAAVRDTAARR